MTKTEFKDPNRHFSFATGGSLLMGWLLSISFYAVWVIAVARAMIRSYKVNSNQ